MAFSPTNFVCTPISVEHARKQYLSTHLDNRYKLSCSQALCAHVLADYARARILYTMMLPGRMGCGRRAGEELYLYTRSKMHQCIRAKCTKCIEMHQTSMDYVNRVKFSKRILDGSAVFGV